MNQPLSSQINQVQEPSIKQNVNSPVLISSEGKTLPETPPKPSGREKIPFQLQERDISIFLMVNRMRYMRTGQIKRLVFTENRSLQSTRRRLKYLYHAGYLGRVQPFVKPGQGQPEVAYFLEKPGAQVLKEHYPEEELKHFKKSSLVKHTFLEHALALSEFRVHLEMALEKNPIVGLHRFVADFEMKQHLKGLKGMEKYKLFHELQHPINKESYVVYPDALIIIKGKGDWEDHQRLYFLEIDRGTESLNRIREKVIGYHLYRQMGILRSSRSQSFKKFGKFSGFKVLIQTSSEKRVQNMRKSLCNLEGSDLVWITHVEKVDDKSVVTKDIWQDYQMEWKSVVK